MATTALSKTQFTGFGVHHKHDHWEPHHPDATAGVQGNQALSKTMKVDKPKLPPPPKKHPHKRHAHTLARRAH